MLSGDSCWDMKDPFEEGRTRLELSRFGFKKIIPKPGKLVFFPSYVLHSVDVNKSKNMRISLSTDMQTFSTNLLNNFIEMKEKQKNVV